MQRSNLPVETTVLEVPALARYARLVRMSAANLATVAGMNVDEINEVRMAAEEAFVYACATDPGDTLRVAFDISDEGLSMDFTLGSRPIVDNDSEPVFVYTTLILDAMCDECAIVDAPERTMHLFKRIGGGDGR